MVTKYLNIMSKTKLHRTLEIAILAGIDISKYYSITQILLALGYPEQPNSRLVKELRALLNQYDIDTSHFTHNGKPTKKLVYRDCPVCGKSFIANSHGMGEDTVRGLQTTCSVGCANTFFRSGTDSPLYVSGKGAYRSKALKHYGHVCNKCGELNPIVLEVHHKDRDRCNNSIDNLVVLCANCHLIEHRGRYSKT